MTDSELNIAIINALGFKVNKESKFERLCYYKADNEVLSFDFMDWEDIMPLCIEHGVSMLQTEERLFIGEYIDFSTVLTRNLIKHEVVNEIPQRALAECLLKVLSGVSK